MPANTRIEGATGNQERIKVSRTHFVECFRHAHAPCRLMKIDASYASVPQRHDINMSSRPTQRRDRYLQLNRLEAIGGEHGNSTASQATIASHRAFLWLRRVG